MRYILEAKLDNRAFAAALVDLGVKGQVRLVEEDGGCLRQRQDADRDGSAAHDRPPAPRKRCWFTACSPARIRWCMEKDNHAKFSSARRSLRVEEALKAQFGDRYASRAESLGAAA